MVLLAKALSGGHVPSGAVLTRKAIFDKVFDRMDGRWCTAPLSPRTISRWPPASPRSTSGIGTLIEKAARTGERLLAASNAMVPRYELVKAVRGKGLMIGIEFGAPVR